MRYLELEGARSWVERLLCSGIVLCCAGALPAQEFHAAARLDPGEVIGIDEIVAFEIEINAAGSLQGDLEPDFELDNFALVGGPFQSTSLRIVNGVQSTGRSLSWQLKPLRLGKATVRSIRIESGSGRVIELDSQEVAVVENAPRRSGSSYRRGGDPLAGFFGEDPFESFFSRPRSRQRRSAEAPRIFLHAEVEPRRPWVGEQLLYTLYLYTETDVSSINPIELPEFKGFWAQKIPQPDQLRPQMVNHEGRRYGRVVLLQWALFPRRAGVYELEPVSARMAVRLMDSSFPSLIPRSREIIRESNAARIEVRVLPEPPPGFTGAVGELALEASLTPQELVVGQAATLTLKVIGKGHLQGLPAPQISELAGLRVFPPQQQSDERLNGKEVHGSRTWSFVVVPERPGQWDLPPLDMPYFDPQRGEYRTASAPLMTMIARGPTQLTQASGDTLQLHPIRTSVLPLAARGGRLPTSVILLVIPWLLVGTLLLVRRRDLGQGVRAMRQHLVAALDRAAGEERPREAAARVEDAWRIYLEERWKIPRGSPSTQWTSLLSARGVDGRAARELAELADDLHYLRYAPKLSSVDDLCSELVERSRRLARTVR